MPIERNSARIGIVGPPCLYCRHRTSAPGVQPVRCIPYPLGVPSDILSRERSHDEPLPDQESDEVYECGPIRTIDGDLKIGLDGEPLTVDFGGRWSDEGLW